MVCSGLSPQPPRDLYSLAVSCSKVHLTATRGEGLVLPWLTRLSLVHACLASGRAGKEKWGWLPSAADSACSVALEALSTERSSRAKASLVMGKGPERLSSAESRSTGDTCRAGTVSAAMASQVCADLAAAVSTVGVQIEGAFLGCGGLGPQVYPARSVGGLPLGCFLGEWGEGWVQAFRFKLEALRDALSTGTVSDAASTGRQGMHSSIPRAPAQGKLIAIIRAVEVRRDSVARALNRSHCGDAFVLAVEVSDNFSLRSCGERLQYLKRYAALLGGSVGNNVTSLVCKMIVSRGGQLVEKASQYLARRACMVSTFSRV